MKRLVSTILVPLFLCTSCVKEERGDCPCYLTLDFDEVIREGLYEEAVATLGPCSDKMLEQRRISLEDYEGTGYEIKVPRDLIQASVVCGFKNVNFSGAEASVPINEQADPIMAFGLERVFDNERETVNVVLHKQFCRIHFTISGLETRTEFPYELCIKALCNGLKLHDLSPVEGAFCAMALEDESKNLSVLVPRQKRNVMSMEFIDKIDGHVQTVNIGEKLEQMGYDWTKADLDDVSINVDFVQMSVQVAIVPWVYDYGYETIEI